MAPCSSPPTSRKLLIIDPKPKSGPPTAPSNSASSSSTTNTPPPEKRTRDQPNLSDCHCCGRRINHTNPNDRLQPLDSVWRIVLLCRKCRKKLYSGQTCPYCFRETGNSGDLFTCSACERRIHKDCVRDYGNCTPWCYLGVGLEGFRVCVDCWVPELLKNSTRVCGRSENKGGLKDKGEAKDLLENVVKDAKCEVEKRALRRAKVGKNVMDLANGASDLSADKDKDSSKADNSSCSGAIEVVDDAELAIQLHRAMNSSPRILRSKSLVKSKALDVSSIRDWNGILYERSGLGKNQVEVQKLGTCVNSAVNEGLNQHGGSDSCIGFSGLNVGLVPYRRDRKRKIWQLNDESTVVSECRTSHQAELKLHSDDPRTKCSMKSSADISEASICVNADRHNSCTNVDRFGQEIVTYKRNRFKQKVCQVNGWLDVSGEFSSCDKHRVAFTSEDGAKSSTGFPIRSGTEVILPNRSCDAEWDRYHLKYAKRVTGTKLDSSFRRYGTSLSENLSSAPALNDSEYCRLDDAKYKTGSLVKNDAEVILATGSCDAEQDRYHFKYSKRVTGTKSHSSFLRYGAFQSENEVSGLALSVSEYQSDDAKLRAGGLVKNDAEVILPSRSCDAEQDRYHYKYGKRVKGSKSDSCFLRYGAFQIENEASAVALSDSEYCQSDDPKLRKGGLVMGDAEVIFRSESCDAEQDRYRCKFSKRDTGTKSDSSFLCYSAFRSENEASSLALSDSEHCQSDDAKLRRGGVVKSGTKVNFPSGNCDTEQERYHWKYGKRDTGAKPDSSFLHYGAFQSENEASAVDLSDFDYCQSDDPNLRAVGLDKSDRKMILPRGSGDAEQDRYHWKYSKRVTGTKSDSSFLHYGALPSESEASAFALTYSEYCQSDDAKLSTGGLVKSDAEVILPSGSCDVEQDCYHWNYGKRVTGSKPDASFLHFGAFPSENKASALVLSSYAAGYSVKCDDDLILPNGSHRQDPDCYRFKYIKRVKSSKSGSVADTKVHSNASMNEIEASAPGLTTNCSAESRTLSDVSFDSFTTDLPK